MELRNISCIDFESNTSPRKIVVYLVIRKKFRLRDIKRIIVAHCLNAAEKIRVDNQVVKSVVVFIRNSPLIKMKSFFQDLKKLISLTN